MNAIPIPNTQTNTPRNFLRDFHQILSSKRSLARAAFNRLAPDQKRLLLLAADVGSRYSHVNADGAPAYTFNLNFDSLTDDEIDRLRRGLNKLQTIINSFALCEQGDFKRENRQ